jgi:hypothetical protein
MFIDQYHKFELHCTLFTLQKSSIITGVSDKGRKRKILLVHRRPPTLGMLLRFRNPLHCKPVGPRNFADLAVIPAPRANT